MAQSTRASESTRNREDQATRLQRSVHAFVRQHPILTVTMAVASGYLAGRTLSRI